MNNTLPIAAFKGEILAAVKNNSVVVITAETGAGKSTQVPQYLLEVGYNIVVTQPRRLAARTVAERVAEEFGEELGRTIGFRTAMERKDSRETRCLFCTDGLALVRELMGAGKHQVLVLDEVHEWNLNIETLVAWVKNYLAQDNNFKVVLMSATLEAEKLSKFFDGAPIISVPGRLFPVEDKRPTGRSTAEEAVALLQQGHNVLVFESGKREIADTIELVKSSKVAAEIIPLHGELESGEQNKAFRRYSQPKCVVSTNVAQTSVTIDDIDAVVDGGMERRIEVVDGVEGLYLKPISLADSKQRKGRAGRCKAGVYIDMCPAANRPDFPVAEILRSRLDQTVLRLAEAGFDMEKLDFFHQPAKSEILEAKRALKALGCLAENGSVTAIGKQVSRLPLSVQFARMVVEADRLGVVDDVVTIAAILEQGEITARAKSQYEAPAWKHLVAGEDSSDLMAQLAIWEKAEGMSKDEMLKSGIFVKAFFQAKEKRRHLADALRGKVREFRSSGNRENILKAVCAGMVDHLYHGQYGTWRNGDDTERQLARESVVRSGDWIVGLPFDLEIKTRRGTMMLRLVRMATKVDPMWLAEIAPQLAKVEGGLNPTFDLKQDAVVSTQQTFFNGSKIREEVVPTSDHPEAANVFCLWLANQMAI
jgi:ATP-dependent helicase HrpA